MRWAHTLWPDANPGPKPPRAEVIPDASIRDKVVDQLRREQALFGRYGERIDTAALQAELDRMARATRAPDQLRDLYAALGNDAQTVADCLARPTLVSRRLRARFGTDDALHGDVRAQAQRALAGGEASAGKAAASDDPTVAGHTRTVTYLRVDDEAQHARDALKAGLPPRPQEIALDPAEWQSLLTRLERAADRDAKAGHPQADETDTAIQHRRILERSDDRLVVQARSWEKRGFDDWWRSEAPRWQPLPLSRDKSEDDAPDLVLTPIKGSNTFQAKNYQPGDVMPDDTWRTENAPEGRYGHTAIWTGSEMIVWGGFASGALSSGGRFDPVTASWRPTATLNAPSPRYLHTAVWADPVMLVWGGVGDGGYQNTGASYDPTTDTWTALPVNAGTPSARYDHTAVWTGTEMIVWGGVTAQDDATNTGARYRPDTETWVATPMNSAPAARAGHTAIWTDAPLNRMIVWGGIDENDSVLDSGGIFDPATPQGSWQATPSLNAPTARFYHTAVWATAPQNMIVWGGVGDGVESNSGSRLSHAGNGWTWEATSESGDVPTARSTHTAVWANDRMLVFGGTSPAPTDGASYDPGTDSWASIPTADQPGNSIGMIGDHSAVWTGDRMLVWGGYRISNGYDSRTLSYNPAGAGTWTILGDVDQPRPRSHHTAVWTETEMLVWGGRDGDGDPTRSGARYVAATGDWRPIPTLDNADHRADHTAVWTGIDMIVWGGINADGNGLQRGARYNPLLGEDGTWVEPSFTFGPPRAAHKAVWAGDRMLLWGGYRPGTVTWYSTGIDLVPGIGNQPSSAAIFQAPDNHERHLFSLTWAAERGELIAWGGLDLVSQQPSADGWRYDPVSKTGTLIPAAADARLGHEAVWTGKSLLVVGGEDADLDLSPDALAYFPEQNAWTSAGTLAQPRVYHTLVWTGAQALAWGGDGDSGSGLYLQSGERLTPPKAPGQTGSVEPITLVGAPQARRFHTAVWSPQRKEMLIWGGEVDFDEPTDTLGVYSARGVPTLFADSFE